MTVLELAKTIVSGIFLLAAIVLVRAAALNDLHITMDLRVRVPGRKKKKKPRKDSD